MIALAHFCWILYYRALSLLDSLVELLAHFLVADLSESLIKNSDRQSKSGTSLPVRIAMNLHLS